MRALLYPAALSLALSGCASLAGLPPGAKSAATQTAEQALLLTLFVRCSQFDETTAGLDTLAEAGYLTAGEKTRVKTQKTAGGKACLRKNVADQNISAVAALGILTSQQILADAILKSGRTRQRFHQRSEIAPVPVARPSGSV
ncbi:MAG: hypothetical protein AAF183_13075 [Pseudomonadota bacterium]